MLKPIDISYTRIGLDSFIRSSKLCSLLLWGTSAKWLEYGGKYIIIKATKIPPAGAASTNPKQDQSTGHHRAKCTIHANAEFYSMHDGIDIF